jgi:hypothetical protein
MHYQPETVEALATAFHKSWSFISNNPRFAAESPALLQRRLSACLMQLALNGEYDPLRLANGGRKAGTPNRRKHSGLGRSHPDCRATAATVRGCEGTLILRNTSLAGRCRKAGTTAPDEISAHGAQWVANGSSPRE